ncbi:hypothetical protein BDZ90DRAFT_170957 [Jaminaea rosea]|uniref:Mtf2-like C-terminal domain-containing protein n=1 Tax=Jaminaea rosea TaxID=1569628 RepID=A0A316UV05_9BASI|nr:hypothetical protein BDZ90DRAFT_170957 [Jaminaea rosea]PWN27753.1 hypothetical protein BDZ90DRAFT_170957 [Jaminaea rosea]
MSSLRGCRATQRLWAITSTHTARQTQIAATRRHLHASPLLGTQDSSSRSSGKDAAVQDDYDEPREPHEPIAGPSSTALDQDPTEASLNDIIGGGMDTPPQPPSSSSSAFDDLFSGPNPFPRAEQSQFGAQYDPVRRERGAPPSRRPTNSSRYHFEDRYSQRGRRPDQRLSPAERNRSGQNAESRMSQQERDTWMKLLDDISGAFDGMPGGSEGGKQPGDHFTPLERFVHRNQLHPADASSGQRIRSTRDAASRTARAAAAEEATLLRLASLGEQGDFGLAARMEQGELASAVDRAEQAMNLCADEAELWAWAGRDVFGFDADEYARRVRKAKLDTEAKVGRRILGRAGSSNQQIEESQAAAPARQDPDISNPSTLSPPYGVNTPLYAPVLHRLFLQLRNRFNSPHSALSLLHIVRSLGPQSLVLGYTPELLGEAVTTRWEAMRDLGGACDTLRDAKAVGALSRRQRRRRPASIGAEGEDEDRSPVDAVVTAVAKVSEEARMDVLHVRTQHLLEEADRREREAEEGRVAGKSKKEHDDFFADWLKDDEDVSKLEEPTEPNAAEKAPPTTVTTASLPLPALDALRIVDEMSGLAGLARSSKRRESAALRGDLSRRRERGTSAREGHRKRDGERRGPKGGIRGEGQRDLVDFAPSPSRREGGRRERDPHSSWGFL